MAETGYSGFAFPFRIGARGGWLMSTTNQVDVPHIKEAIMLIVATYVGERVCEMSFGSEAHDAIFGTMDVTLANLLRFKIESALAIWETRITVTDIGVDFIDDEIESAEGGKVVATINFTVLRTQVEESVAVTLRREGLNDAASANRLYV